MSLALRRCLKLHANLLSSGNTNMPSVTNAVTTAVLPRSFSDDKSMKENQFSDSTIIVESGLNVHELPVVVRKLWNISDFDVKKPQQATTTSSDSHNYGLIQEEFKQCMDLRDVFSLLSKCTKITPNIALGAMERIYDLEKSPTAISLVTSSNSISIAKGAILDKLLRVIIKTEDTQTILNILNTESTLMEPYKPKFSDELLLRVVDNRLTIEQLCSFVEFLMKNKSNPKYLDTTDKLWVGIIERENDIDEHNIAKIFEILNAFKSSKRPILTLLEQKFAHIWWKIKVPVMQNVLNVFLREKCISYQSFAVVGTWLYSNIHTLDQESMLDIISKLTRLNYSDVHVEKAIQKYMKLKGDRVDSHILIIGILNYCQHFKIRNEVILNSCSDYFLANGREMPLSFLRSVIFPFGYLHFDPKNGSEFWALTEDIVDKEFYKMSTESVCSILLSSIYSSKYPLKFVNRLFSPEYLSRVSNSDTMKKLHLIDTALSLECSEYAGPLLPKDQCIKPVPQDPRIRNIIKKTLDIFQSVSGGADKLSTAVMVANIISDGTYLIDVLIHQAGNKFNWGDKSNRNGNIAVLINLPDHFCSDNEHLIGPQVLRKKHLQILGMKVVNLKYSVLSQYYTSCNITGLRKYVMDCMGRAE